MSYGASFKYIRELNGFSQSELARQTGIKQQNISRWESGAILPSIENCATLANFYNVSIDYLIGLEDDGGAKLRESASLDIKKPPAMDAEAKRLLDIFDELSENGKQQMLAMAKNIKMFDSPAIAKKFKNR